MPVLLLAPDGTQQNLSTGGDGSYDFDTLSPGTYAVSVGQLPGIDRQEVVVDTSHLVQVVNFTLAGAIVSGTVVGPDGKAPVANAVVALAQGDSVLVTTQTDSKGSYEFEGVVPGSYSVETGGSTGTAAAQPITVGAASVTVPALQVGSLNLTGLVFDPAGNPFGGANLLLTSTLTTDAELGLTTTTAANGSFTLGSLVAGQYTLTVVANGFVTQIQQLTVSSTGSPITVRLQGGTSLSGTITDATTGLPITQATVELISLAINQEVATVQADASGAYRLAHVPPGSYDLVVADPQGTHRFAEILNVAVGATPLVVNAQLTAANTDLRGVVTDRQNHPIASAIVQFTDSNGHVLATATTDFNGTYSITVLPPGMYGVEAVAVGYLPVAAQNVTVSGSGNLVGPTFTLQVAGVDNFLTDFFNLIDSATGSFVSGLFAEFDPAHQPQPEDFQVPLCVFVVILF